LNAHFGIWPRQPGRLLILVVGLALAAVVAALMLVLALAGEFGRHSPREFYYLWLVGLIVLGLLLAPRPGWAALPLALAIVDLGLGAGSLALERSGAGVLSIMPPPFHPGGGYRWHPLLQIEPIPSLPGGVPGLKINHSSAGTRGPEHTAAELERKRVVAVFGGSTTYDIAVTDGETWPDRLEQQLGADRWSVINHGVPGYSTVEHLVQTAFYANAFGRRPDCAVYYVGWNDIRNAGTPGLDSAYVNHLRSQVDALKARRVSGDFYTPSPVLTLAIRLLAVAVDTVRPAEPLIAAPIDRPDETLEHLFTEHVAAISAINHGRGIRTIWVGQLLNASALTGNEPSGWTPLIRRRDLWPMQRRLNELLRQRIEAAGDVYADVPASKFGAEDFADIGHFSAAGSAKFAALLAPTVSAQCR
jgi:lysophospholipase L1-like esterase